MAFLTPATASKRGWVKIVGGTDTAEATARRNAASGYAGLETDSKILGAQQRYGTIADTALQGSEKAAASGVASLNSSSKVVQDPASATTTPANDGIVKLNGSGNLETTMQAKVLLSNAGAPTAAVSFGSQRITNLATPTADTDAATKAYVDARAAGLAPKASCMVATAAALETCTYDNGSSGVGATLTRTGNGALTIDGISSGSTVPLANGQRVLVKDQVAGLQNGIYVITAIGGAGAPWVLTRATDADSSTTLIPGAFAFIVQGDTNDNNGYACSNNGTITVGSTAVTFAQFSSAGVILAGAGMVKSNDTLNVVAADATIVVNTDSIQAGVMQAANLASSAVTNTKIADGAVSGDKIAALGVAAGKYAPGSIATADIADLAISTAKIAALAVTNAKLASDAVSGDKVAALGISAGKYALGSIATADVADGAITTAKLGAASVSAAKLGSDVAGTGLGGGSGAAITVTYGSSGFTTVEAGDAAAAGSADTSARSDHQHAVSTAAPSGTQFAASAAEGTASQLARADHRHSSTPAANGDAWGKADGNRWTMSSSGQYVASRIEAADYVVVDTDELIVMSAATQKTITLPAGSAAINGRVIRVVQGDAGGVNIVRSGSDVFSDQSTAFLTAGAGESVTFIASWSSAMAKVIWCIF